ncbi:MAG: phosphate propanoyltransferase [Oscillospiraceae bacterium]|nr:phosphate propanoyltransferase [Oscillospiraceae bacterium]
MSKMEILVETSARHMHLTQETIEILFGKGHQLTKKADLSQPGQFACEERVTIVGPKKELCGVSVLGPARPADQIEISATDARSIGIPIFVRESSDLTGTPGCKLVGPKGEVAISEGVIVAKRHAHLTPATAEKWGLTNGQIVNLKVESQGRSAILGDVVARVNAAFADAVHIDTDESNAVMCERGMTCWLTVDN